jgi:protein tyrosine/serine phosphatase
MTKLITYIFLILLIGCSGPTIVLDKDSSGNPIVIRGPQPDFSKLHWLQEKHGVKTVISFRSIEEGTDNHTTFLWYEFSNAWYSKEKRSIRSLNDPNNQKPMKLLLIDLDDGTKPPTKKQLDYFYSIIEDKNNWPIYMHCQGGIHRAGMMSAIYRMKYQGWKKEKAIWEMESHLYDWSISNRSAVKKFLWFSDFERSPSFRR